MNTGENTSIPTAAPLRDLNPELDARDFETLHHRAEAYAMRQHAQVGDFVEMLDGKLRRFTYDWGDDIQVTSGEGSFYITVLGADYSGAFDPSIAKNKLVDTARTRTGRFWIFHHDIHRAHHGIEVFLPCKVWTVHT